MRSLNKSKENEWLYQELGNKENKLFSSMKDVYTLTALIGGLLNERKSFEGSSGDAIKDSLFSRSEKTFFDFIAIDSTKDLNILKNEFEAQEEKVDLMESYSNAGIKILKEHLGDNYLNLDNLISAVENIDKLIDEYKETEKNSANSLLLGANIRIN